MTTAGAHGYRPGTGVRPPCVHAPTSARATVDSLGALEPEPTPHPLPIAAVSNATASCPAGGPMGAGVTSRRDRDVRDRRRPALVSVG